MGIAFITDKAKKFEQQRDAAFEDQLVSGNLLSQLPDTSRTTYRCKSIVNVCPNLGSPVLLYKGPDGVNVFSLNRHVGVAMSSDAIELGKVMETMNTDVLAAQVVEVSSNTNIFYVQLTIPTP